MLSSISVLPVTQKILLQMSKLSVRYRETNLKLKVEWNGMHGFTYLPVLWNKISPYSVSFTAFLKPTKSGGNSLKVSIATFHVYFILARSSVFSCQKLPIKLALWYLFLFCNQKSTSTIISQVPFLQHFTKFNHPNVRFIYF